MCGIVGVVQASGKPIAVQGLEVMRDVLVHRGPDDMGSFVGDGVGLGHRRLSIVDLSERARQPMSNEDDTVLVVFNGEIYNYVELRKNLIDKGHRFKSESDTEVIVHLYEEYGDECVLALRGMFAFILWDVRERRLLAARDRVGKKPLYYANDGSTLILASEIKALLQWPGITKRPNLEAVHQYLALQYVSSPLTAFSDIRSIPPGHLLVWRNGSTYLSRYWSLRYLPKWECKEEVAAERLSHVLEEAVRLRLRADVPLGIHLSGGLDSSIVAAVAGGMGARLRSFCVGFEGFDGDERHFARQVSQHVGSQHEELVVHADVLKLLPRLVYHYDQPFADPAAIPTFALCEATRRTVKVALNGDGGDEAFGGYGRDIASAHWRLPRFLRRPAMGRWLAGELRECHAAAVESLLRFCRYYSEDPELQYCRVMSQFSPEWLWRLYSDDMREAVALWAPYEPLLRAFGAAKRQKLGRLDTHLAVDMETYLPENLLVKVDVASMAWGLEVRSPFLDHRLIECAARLPELFKVRGHERKRLLRTVGARLALPTQILRREKAGFGVPLARWFREELRSHVREILLDGRLRRSGYFRVDMMEKLLDSHQSGARDHSRMLWGLLVLETWNQVYLN